MPIQKKKVINSCKTAKFSISVAKELWNYSISTAIIRAIPSRNYTLFWRFGSYKRSFFGFPDFGHLNISSGECCYIFEIWYDFRGFAFVMLVQMPENPMSRKTTWTEVQMSENHQSGRSLKKGGLRGGRGFRHGIALIGYRFPRLASLNWSVTRIENSLSNQSKTSWLWLQNL